MTGARLLVGTVRALRGGAHVVVGRDGSVTDITFEGGSAPLQGADVIGTVVESEGRAAMRLHASVTDALLEGRARIAPAGSRPDVTARVLAKVLSRSRGVIAPGAGVSLERSPTSDDPDLNWAISAFRAEADRTATALNVLDVRAVARAPWKTATLNDLTLPADVEGETRAMRDLKRMLATGFHPDCNRMIERVTGEGTISVNYVLAYSPFAGPTSFARTHGLMDRGYAAMPLVDVSEARRLTAARHVALALAHSRLGAGAGVQADVGQSRRAAHLAACFADAAATLAFLSDGGREGAVAHYARLKLASLHFGRRAGSGALMPHVLVEATHRSILAAMDPALRGARLEPREIVAEAARIARRTALPAKRFAGASDMPTGEEIFASAAAAADVAVGVRSGSRADLSRMAAHYSDEIRALVAENSDSELAAARLATFAAADCPLGMEEIFEREARVLPRADHAAVALPALAPARRPTRLRAGGSTPIPDEFDQIEFAEPFASPAP